MSRVTLLSKYLWKTVHIWWILILKQGRYDLIWIYISPYVRLNNNCNQTNYIVLYIHIQSIFGLLHNISRVKKLLNAFSKYKCVSLQPPSPQPILLPQLDLPPPPSPPPPLARWWWRQSPSKQLSVLNQLPQLSIRRRAGRGGRARSRHSNGDSKRHSAANSGRGQSC